MNADSRREDDVTVEQTGAVDHFSDAGACRLNPTQARWGTRQVRRRHPIEVEENIGLCEVRLPTLSLCVVQLASQTLMVSDVARYRQQFGIEYHAQSVGIHRTNAINEMRLQGRSDD